jgi:isopentenyl phosphate kinase
MTKQSELIFLKLGGSLITDKSKPLTTHEETIKRLAEEVVAFKKENPQTHLVIGHGSGSFGHVTASKYQTQDGVRKAADWQGFAEVWYAARQLNQIMIQQFTDAGLSVICFPPSAGIISSHKRLISWDIQPIKEALSHDLVPVVLGDVVFDIELGGTIFSTEQVFQYLALELHPERILLAGSDPGVFRDPEQSEEIIQSITPADFDAIASSLFGSSKTDVTGGMLSKVEIMLSLVKKIPELTVRIFSAIQPDDLQKALAGEDIGTLIRS